ncbi:PREDICTED: cell wall / vacuolar inhibitor of fructosidase 2 [Ipomoea nil]|uniref:cell wall / vacuolar inhibitor of fructosidase 2 n=1 Tax=Ipomoea nil TaxID=35883 RepID=UPI000900D1AC|nr:PREDICTED: cell wall / vacuolar inhibitor of fructosidase 2 [Ipomoea nil]
MGSDYYHHYCRCFLAIIIVVVLLLNPVHGDSSDDLIQKTCKNTKYYDLCVSSLKSDSTSSKASDTKDLAQIMVRVGVANATATKSYLSSLIGGGGGGGGSSANDTSATMKKLLRDCADKYSYAGDALLASIQDLDAEMYDYAYMHVMAAADYPNVCHNGFRRYPGLAYPRQLAIREQGFKRICDVVMEMLDSLAALS